MAGWKQQYELAKRHFAPVVGFVSSRCEAMPIVTTLLASAYKQSRGVASRIFVAWLRLQLHAGEQRCSHIVTTLLVSEGR
jgi:hypothetical protein